MQDDLLAYRERLARLRSGLPGKEALLLFDARNIRYLTGFTGTDGALLAGPDWLTLLVDGRYVTQAREEAAGAEIFEFRNRVDGIGAVARQRSPERIRFESPRLAVEEYLRLQEGLPGISLEPEADRFRTLRAVKDAAEIERIRQAARIAADAVAAVRPLIRPGVREEEIALEIEYRMRLSGAGQVAFETIVASGPRSALPHATPGKRRLADGDFVTIDYGAVFAGYHSDETCTFALGRVSDRQREVYRLVREAHDRAIGTVRAGVSCAEVDRAARSCLAEAGLGDYFSHGTGHGVGLDVHEAPRLAAGREEPLAAGMVVTVEPGVYIPGLWGVRIEDTVVVTDSGCDILTPTTKDFTIL
jgi:Xaa-Pro aminopeptidase/Xaa-Pro dipeptidase